MKVGDLVKYTEVGMAFGQAGLVIDGPASGVDGPRYKIWWFEIKERVVSGWWDLHRLEVIS